jgi:DNA-binding NarL/FixJ family response regulator
MIRKRAKENKAETPVPEPPQRQNTTITPRTGGATFEGRRPAVVGVYQDASSPTVSREFLEAFARAREIAAVQDALEDQRKQSTRKSIKTRLEKRSPRDRRICEQLDAGKPAKQVADNEKLSLSQVNRIYKARR